MEQRPLGTTGLMTSAIGFGTWEMSTTMYGDIDVSDASRAVNAAIDRGITLFDTAEVYGPFHSERLLAKAIGKRRDEIVLVTKVGFEYDDARIVGTNSTHDYVVERTNTCLERLDTDVIDLMLIHWPDHDTPMEEPMTALEKLKTEGKIRSYGVSNFNVEMMEECQRHGTLTANQVGYNLFDRRMEAEILPWCQANGVGYMAYGSLGFGLLTGAFGADVTFGENDWRRRGVAFGLPLFEREWLEKEVRVTDRLATLAAEHGRSLPQMAISWVLGNPAVSVALVGMRNEQELDENVAAAEWQLPDDLRAAVDRVFTEEDVPTYVDHPQQLFPG
ncbi:MAG: aldo/keto reductase [Actinomycetia bacterium]|nr:aldo/keto reductase [Actinomycetes bacterium]MCP5034789.1 aldo/keto reductase [Actinomycetes bacterium]